MYGKSGYVSLLVASLRWRLLTYGSQLSSCKWYFKQQDTVVSWCQRQQWPWEGSRNGDFVADIKSQGIFICDSANLKTLRGWFHRKLYLKPSGAYKNKNTLASFLADRHLSLPISIPVDAITEKKKNRKVCKEAVVTQFRKIKEHSFSHLGRPNPSARNNHALQCLC